ncbi:hypothetical protein K438DRAFT_1781123 [Mycena galopus ATCC 62051]|nr:hypothetical protein K438DRAFT_1781123 [Mycena galopus ATCC 62051]
MTPRTQTIQAPGVEPAISACFTKMTVEDEAEYSASFVVLGFKLERADGDVVEENLMGYGPFGRRESNLYYSSACLSEDRHQMKWRCAAHYAQFIMLGCTSGVLTDFWNEWERKGREGKKANVCLDWSGSGIRGRGREVGFTFT